MNAKCREGSSASINAEGQHITFIEGEGPQLEALNDPPALGALRAEIDHQALAPIYGPAFPVRRSCRWPMSKALRKSPET
jgi:hypothetical protein